MAATLGTEMVVPLGYAVWLTYFMAVGITLFQRRMEVPLLVAIGSCILLAGGYNVAPAGKQQFGVFLRQSQHRWRRVPDDGADRDEGHRCAP